jgi:hypothetical protein
MKGTLKGIAIGSACSMLVFVAASAVAGTGVGGVFNLGQSNTVDQQTQLSGSVSGNPQLRVENASNAAGSFGALGKMTSSSADASSAGVRGVNSGHGAGVVGIASQADGIGVSGQGTTGAAVKGVTGNANTSVTDTDGAVVGIQSSQRGSGVFGRADSSFGIGVHGIGKFDGVKGESTTAFGVEGRSTDGVGVEGSSNNDFGGSFVSGSGDALQGKTFAAGRSAAIGEWAGNPADSGVGVTGTTFGQGSDSAGVLGQVEGDSGGAGVKGIGGGFKSDGVVGTSFNGRGGFFSGFSVGIEAEAKTGTIFPGTGVIGRTTDTNGTGVEGVANSGSNAAGVVGASTSGLAGRFEGNVHVTGTLTRAYTTGTASQATPIAYGVIKSDGTKAAATPNVVASSYDSVNKRYLITIAGQAYNSLGFITVVNSLLGGPITFAQTGASSGKLVVTFTDVSGIKQPKSFSFVTYKP